MNLWGSVKNDVVDCLQIFQCESYLVDEKALQPYLGHSTLSNASIIEYFQDVCLVTVLLGHLRLAFVIYMIPKGVNVNVSFRIHNSQKNEKE